MGLLVWGWVSDLSCWLDTMSYCLCVDEVRGFFSFTTLQLIDNQYFMDINFKDVLYRHRHLLHCRIDGGKASSEDYRNLRELNYLIQCLKEFKNQDAQLTSVTNRLSNRL